MAVADGMAARLPIWTIIPMRFWGQWANPIAMTDELAARVPIWNITPMRLWY